jgi:hypothetical protein
MKVCERCGSRGEMITTGPFAGMYQGLDYCAKCSRDLCSKCMSEGCCGSIPAKSGNEEDNEEDE